jgi:hypothetical protein
VRVESLTKKVEVDNAVGGGARLDTQKFARLDTQKLELKHAVAMHNQPTHSENRFSDFLCEVSLIQALGHRPRLVPKPESW